MSRSPIHDESLGRLAWDTVLDRLSTMIDLGFNHEVQLNIDAPDGDIVASHIECARQIGDRFRLKGSTYKDQMAAEMLDCFNDVWNQGEPMSLDSFKDELELESITVINAHELEVSYLPKDKWLFGGHFLVCYVHEDDSVTGSHLVG